MARTLLQRRPERIIEFTPQSLADLPVAKGYTDIWYDRDCPILQANKVVRVRETADGLIGEHIRFSTCNSYQTRRGARREGIKLSQYTVLGYDLSIEEARKKAQEHQEKAKVYAANGQYKPGEERLFGENKRAKKASIPGNKTFNVQALLRDKSKENPRMDKLWEVLSEAFSQASDKGLERHGAGAAFEDQDMIHIQNAQGIGYALGQAMKKLAEGRRLPAKQAREEFLGAMVYIAGAIVWLDE